MRLVYYQSVPIIATVLSTICDFTVAEPLIDASCNRYDPQALRNAVREAAQIAKNGVHRANVGLYPISGNQDVKKGGIPKELLEHYMGPGDDSLVSFRKGMELSLAALSTDGHFVIKCGTAHLEERVATNGQKVYLDSEGQNMLFLKGRCTPNEMALTYRRHYPGNNAKWVIVLCEGPKPAALSHSEKVIGTDWNMRNWENIAYDTLWDYVSTTVLHESMPTIQDGVIAGILNSGRKEETSWDAIGELEHSDKVYNAESYSALASVLWMRQHSYQNNGRFGPILPFDKQSPAWDDRHGAWPISL
ncbi:hypothetical protein EJ08DRAFT_398162 [Tothia fuscella]|uniref:Uncharacterized protein n=1 Tax=Tothia fuscella TaxID=1048955 RepID=A0A9P4NKN9_9PEZI|nr:hypothetical protein EJ08DRAFT_398162 [Tothia fuscella]